MLSPRPSWLDRVRQTLVTLTYLEPRQWYYRVLYRLRAPRAYTGETPSQCIAGHWVKPVQRPQTYHGANTFKFLDDVVDFGTDIEWNISSQPRLWLYNLHYFDYLQSAQLLDDPVEGKRLIENWIAMNPVDHGQGWDAYTLSLRIVNWIKWCIRTRMDEPSIRNSLALQANALAQRVEHHLMANHVLANAKALMYVGTFFCGEAANRWRDQGLKILREEHARQIYADGGHCERSPMYHAIMLEDVLDLINLTRAFPARSHRCPTDDWQQQAQRMQTWLTALCHPDGRIAFFNDATWDFASTHAQITTFARRLGVVQGTEAIQRPSHIMPDTGFLRLSSSDAVLLADIGSVGPDYQPGHAHAGTLSCELSVVGQRVLVNSGISTYVEGPVRLAQRSTRSHNTVEIAGENSSDVWASFRVARRARAQIVDSTASDELCTVSVEHDGYRYLSPPVKHQRTFQLKDQSLKIVDELSSAAHVAVARYFLHPNVSVEEGILLIKTGRDFGTRQDIEQSSLTLAWNIKDADVCIKKASWHPGLGRSLNCLCLEATLHSTRCELNLTW